MNPVIAIVNRNPDLRIGSRIQQTFLARVFANRVRHGAGSDAVIDLVPRLPAIVRAPEMRIHVVEPQRVRGGVSRLRIEMPRLHIEDAGPRLHLRWCNVGPLRAAIDRELNHAVAGSCPKNIQIERRRRERCDGPNGRRINCDGILPRIRGNLPVLPRVRSPLIAVTWPR